MVQGAYTVNVEVAIVRGNDYLMITRGEAEEHAAGTLAFPGGKVDPGTITDDVLEKTARREVQEEVGLSILHLQYLESKSFLADDGVLVLDVVFIAEVESGEPCIGDVAEVAELHWLRAEEVLHHEKTPPWIARSIRLAEAGRAAVGL